MADKVRVFLSYRRADTQHVAGRAGDRLGEMYELFMDIDTIPPGVDFTDYVRRAVGAATSYWLSSASTGLTRPTSMAGDVSTTRMTVLSRRSRSRSPAAYGSSPSWSRVRRCPPRAAAGAVAPAGLSAVASTAAQFVFRRHDPADRRDRARRDSPSGADRHRQRPAYTTAGRRVRRAMGERDAFAGPTGRPDAHPDPSDVASSSDRRGGDPAGRIRRRGGLGGSSAGAGDATSTTSTPAEGTPASSTRPSPTRTIRPAATLRQLNARIPDSIRQTCENFVPTSAALRASLLVAAQCVPADEDNSGRTPVYSFYFSYADTEAAMTAYRRYYAPRSLPSGDCSSEPAEMPYSRDGISGTLRCYEDSDGYRVFAWTADELSMVVSAADQSMSYAEMLRWYQHAGPLT